MVWRFLLRICAGRARGGQQRIGRRGVPIGSGTF